VKNGPKCSPPLFCQNFDVENSSPKVWATSVILKQLPKVNSHPKMKKSTNVVTLKIFEKKNGVFY
jgi:hypothetical protein